jgi:hypothetical protein
MEYASSVWDPTNRKKIGNLEKVQKEPQDSFSTITQTEHLAVLLKWLGKNKLPKASLLVLS